MEDLRILVIGASMGGIKVFPNVIKQITPDTPVAAFIVQHISSAYKSELASMLSNHTKATVKVAEDQEPIQAGHIYVSPTDQHLIVGSDKMTLSSGPQENNSRPSINALFRSAAIAHHNRVIGLLLTGLLADGAKGIKAVHECGGITVVQDPEDAEFDEMPRNAIKATDVDYIVAAADISSLLKVLLDKPLKGVDVTKLKVPPELKHQVAASLKPLALTVEEDSALPSNFQKPEFPVELDDSLWSVLQYMQERTTMLENMAENEHIRDQNKMARDFELRAQESRAHTENLRAHLLELELGHSTSNVNGSSGLRD